MSTVKASVLESKVANNTVILTKQWNLSGYLHFQGSGTVTNKYSFNIANIVDEGTGDYTINTASPYRNANSLCMKGGAGNTTNNTYVMQCVSTGSTPSSSSRRVYVTNDNAVLSDLLYCELTIVGILA